MAKDGGVDYRGVRRGNARIGLIFSAVPPETRTWPYVGYDYEARVEKILEHLRKRLEGIELVYRLVYSLEEAERAVEEMGDVDGYVVYFIGIWTGTGQVVARTGKPIILVDDLYAGTGEFLLTLANMRRMGYPVVGVASSNFEDVVSAIRLLKVIHEFRNSRILVVADVPEGRRREVRKHVEYLKSRYGVELVYVSSDQVNRVYEEVSDEDAREVVEKWVEEAEKVVEPSKEELLKSAKIYLALKRLVEEHDVDAVTVDCLNLVYAGKLPAYPCLAFLQFNNDGLTATCEADIDSTATMLLLRYLTGRPSFVSDPVLDQATQQIVYAHCVAPTRVYGLGKPAAPYIIRSHAEDRSGASVQALLPLGEVVTTVKLNLREEAIAVHTAVTTANVEEEKACRTKLAARADVDAILENWNVKVDFGWHRVTVYGDWRRQLISLARLMKLRVVEEDRL